MYFECWTCTFPDSANYTFQSSLSFTFASSIPSKYSSFICPKFSSSIWPKLTWFIHSHSQPEFRRGYLPVCFYMPRSKQNHGKSTELETSLQPIKITLLTGWHILQYMYKGESRYGEAGW